MNFKSYALVFGICLLAQVGFPQINFKVGYNGVAPIWKATKAIFSTYNDTNDPAVPFKNPNYLQGLDVGARYSWQSLSAEIGWTNLQSANLKTDGTAGTDNWRISSSEYYFTLCSQWKYWGIGSSVGFNRIRYKQLIEGTNNRRNIVEENFLNLKVFISLEAQGEYNAIAIRPFYQPNLKTWDIAGLSNAINAGGVTPMTENFEAFGISLFIYNGPQHSR